jgi:colanic acid/amylovoran biosynthesis glycosyltransferase
MSDIGNGKHIVYVVDHFPTLSQTFIENQMRTLIELGFRVTVVSFGRGDDNIRHETTDWLTERIALHVVPLPDPSEWRHSLTQLWRARRRGTVLLRLLRRLGAYRWRVVLAAASAGLPVLKADAILAHFGPNGLYAAALRELGVMTGPIATFFHGYDFSSFVRASRPGVYDLLFRSADHVIANSRYSRGRLEAMGCPPARLSVVPVGLLPENFPPPAHRSIRTPVRFLTVARLVEKKGHAVALAENGIAAHLTLIGDGPHMNRLIAHSHTLGLAGRVTFAGAQPQAAVHAAMLACDVFLLASIEASDGDVEGQGLVLQEAQACGLPVIATRHNGFPESIQDGVTGLLVPERDARALAEAMTLMASDHDSRARMAAAGPDFVRSRFDQRMLTRRLVDILGI